MEEIPTLGQYRMARLQQRLALCERALIDAEAVIRFSGLGRSWNTTNRETQDHYRTLAENELIREGLVRPKRVRAMEEQDT